MSKNAEHYASADLVGACFQPSYASARAAFLAAAARAGARTDVFINDRATGPNGSTLTTDVAVLGPDDAQQALLIISATHGPEGFVGSAAQISLLNALANQTEKPSVRIVLVHAINPWGFSHISRTTENNVDLNRNFIDWDAAVPENPLYADLHPTLSPTDWTPEALEQANAQREAWVAKHGQDAFVDVTARGQYTHDQGIHYGGTGREWSNYTLEAIVERHLDGVKRIALIDWHTGLGEPGQPFFLCFNEPGDAGWQRACNWWGKDEIETKGGFEGAARPNYSGLVFYGVQRFAKGAEVTGAVIEFGTKNRTDMRRSLQIDQYLKHGKPVTSEQRAQMREELLDAFAPLSLDWKRSVLGHAIKIQEQALDGLKGWN